MMFKLKLLIISRQIIEHANSEMLKVKIHALST